MDYCTPSDVLGVATDYKGDTVGETSESGVTYQPNTNVIAQSEIEAMITEASVMVDSKLTPRYSLTVIQALSPLPPIVVYLTKTYTAIMLYERIPSVSIDRKNKQIEQLQRSMKEYQTIITNGGLRDSTGTLIATLSDPGVLKGSDNTDFDATGLLKDLYDGEEVDSGRFY